MGNPISRRSFLKLGMMFSSLSLIPSRSTALRLLAPDKFYQNDDIYHFTVGDLQCMCINDGGSKYPLENIFKNVPKKTIEDTLRNMGLPIEYIYTPYTELVVNTGKQKILVDMGAGENLASYMKLAGIDPSEIDTVIISHAHPDHIGGTLDDNGNAVYKNAHYYIWKDEWDFWFSSRAEKIVKESHIKIACEQLGPVKDRMIFLEKESEIFPGVEVIAAPGHTAGHIVVSFSSKEETLYYAADTVISPLHLEHPDWLPVYDLEPEKAAISKNKIFNLLADKKALMLGQHFVPFPSLGHVTKKEIGWKFKPIG